MLENTGQKTIYKLNTTQKKQTRQNTAKQNYPGIPYYDTRPGNKVGIFYNAHEPTWLKQVKSPCCATFGQKFHWIGP